MMSHTRFPGTNISQGYMDCEVDENGMSIDDSVRIIHIILRY